MKGDADEKRDSEAHRNRHDDDQISFHVPGSFFLSLPPSAPFSHD